MLLIADSYAQRSAMLPECSIRKAVTENVRMDLT